MIVFSEASTSPRHHLATQISRLTEEAKQNDIKVCYIPEDFDTCTAAEALEWCPYFDTPTPGFFLGYIPTPGRYEQLYEAALEHNVRLINSPDESDRTMDFERFYPLITDLTPESWVVKRKQDLKPDFPFPLFVKGAIKSRKEHGWKACVAENKKELKEKCAELWRYKYTARNKAVLRRIIDLKHTEKTPAGFPLGREFRVILYNNEVVGYSYYWSDFASDKLTQEEERQVTNLARLASIRIGAPLVTIDVGQDTDDKWWVIEAGDPQFCALTHVHSHLFWQYLKNNVVY